jgi:hypothetical protein
MPPPIKVELLPHDPDWSRLANAEAQLLTGAQAFRTAQISGIQLQHAVGPLEATGGGGDRTPLLRAASAARRVPADREGQGTHTCSQRLVRVGPAPYEMRTRGEEAALSSCHAGKAETGSDESESEAAVRVDLGRRRSSASSRHALRRGFSIHRIPAHDGERRSMAYRG